VEEPTIESEKFKIFFSLKDLEDEEFLFLQELLKSFEELFSKYKLFENFVVFDLV
jgi:hypothetical protein